MRGRRVLLGALALALPLVLALAGAVLLLHRPPADAPSVVQRAGVGWCPAAGAAPMPAACVPRP